MTPYALRRLNCLLALIELQEIDGDICWMWTGACSSSSTPICWDGSTSTSVVRVLYRLLRGPIDARKLSHPTCRRRGCVNPWHRDAPIKPLSLAPGKLYLGAAIRRHRRLNQLTQAELAQLVQVSPAAISNLERNKTSVSQAMLTRLTTALQVSVGELVCVAT
jgi:DNA-binding XRE family transcriptional regulator